jgi:TRAP-type C4-dicarboxylate transport system permease small subunit
MKLERLINSGLPIISGVLLSLIVTFVFLQIIVRNLFNISLTWSDEGAQFCMMWMVLLGSIYLTKHDRHITTGIKVHQKLNIRLIGLIDSILSLATVTSAGVVAYQGAVFTFSGYRAISLPWLKMEYVYIALPLFMFAMCYYYAKSFFKNLALVFKKNKKI